MDVEEFKQKYEELKDNPMYKNFCSILDTKSQVLERIAKENQELKNSLERYQKELNEENLQCSKYAIEINDLKERLKTTKELVEEHVKKEIDLKEINKDISKGLQKVSIKRNKWKKRYETEHRRKQELNRKLKELEEQSASAINEQVSRGVDLTNQQKEFIEYLEKNINHYKEIIKSDRENNTKQDCRRFETRWTTYEESLSKYKEIVGVKDE